MLEKQCKKDKKKERQVATKRCQEIDKKVWGKWAAARGENTEISTRKGTKNLQMPLTEHSKILGIYKF